MQDADFTEDDVGKDVVDANGNDIGIISAVEHGTAYIEPDPGLTDKLKTSLGWEETGEDTYPLQEASVDTLTENEVRLRSDL